MTSTGSAMAVPSWPLDAGRLIPQQWGAGVLFEWGHRAIAGTVSILTLTLALWVWMAERRAWVRYTALAAFGLVVVQAVLGGITVLLNLPLTFAVAHAMTGQAFFCLMVAIAMFTNPRWADDGAAGAPDRSSLADAARGRDHGDHLFADNHRRADAAHACRARDSRLSAGLRPSGAADVLDADRGQLRPSMRRGGGHGDGAMDGRARAAAVSRRAGVAPPRAGAAGAARGADRAWRGDDSEPPRGHPDDLACRGRRGGARDLSRADASARGISSARRASPALPRARKCTCARVDARRGTRWAHERRSRSRSHRRAARASASRPISN